MSGLPEGDRKLKLLEEGGCTDEEPQQKAQARLQRGGRAAPGRVDRGGPDL